MQERFREALHRITLLAPESVGFSAHLDASVTPSAIIGKVSPLLTIKGLEGNYGRIKALKGVDLKIFPGEL